MKKFGIEIEVSDRSPWRTKISHAVRKNWGKIKADGAINCGFDHCGYEYRTPPMYSTSENIKKIEKFLMLMTREPEHDDQYPDPAQLFHRSTGLHIHVDLEELDKQAINNLFKSIYLFEPYIYKLQAPGRTNNSYCGPIRSRVNAREINEKDFSQRKEYGNLLSRSRCSSGACLSHRYNTIEFRYAQGSFDPEDVTMWITLLLIVVENAKYLGDKFNVPYIQNNSSHKYVVDPKFKDPKLFLKFLAKAKSSRSWLKYRRPRVIRWVEKKLAA